jgi:hypothetical protein
MAAPEGNTNSSKSNRLFANTIRRIATQEPERLRRIVEALYDKAEQGDNNAIQQIGDRLDGKPAQVIQGDEDNPLAVITRIEQVIIDSSKG